SSPSTRLPWLVGLGDFRWTRGRPGLEDVAQDLLDVLRHAARDLDERHATAAVTLGAEDRLRFLALGKVLGDLVQAREVVRPVRVRTATQDGAQDLGAVLKGEIIHAPPIPSSTWSRWRCTV